jgi:hypothetical protein
MQQVFNQYSCMEHERVSCSHAYLQPTDLTEHIDEATHGSGNLDRFLTPQIELVAKLDYQFSALLHGDGDGSCDYGSSAETGRLKHEVG